jgi:hypothetical protein
VSTLTTLRLACLQTTTGKDVVEGKPKRIDSTDNREMPWGAFQQHPASGRERPDLYLLSCYSTMRTSSIVYVVWCRCNQHPAYQSALLQPNLQGLQPGSSGGWAVTTQHERLTAAWKTGH